MRKKCRLPEFLQTVLWSYDLNRLNLEEDKDLVITQALNYGDWRVIRWLYTIYKEADIKDVVSHPAKGMWFDKVLNFWQKMLDIRIPAKIRKKAIFTMEPEFIHKAVRS
ncbi:MAG: hypothetical protein HZB36_04400 [Candidatus Omnitrophica bacterium]|nr:hypothetical protein [Candidatus Omnitrophota bacterium]